MDLTSDESLPAATPTDAKIVQQHAARSYSRLRWQRTTLSRS